MKFIRLLILLSFVSCKPSSNRILIDKTVEEELELNKKTDENSDFPLGNNSYFSFSSKETGPILEENNDVNSIENIFSNSDGLLLRNVCGCELKNDTIRIFGGLFYVGGIGYKIEIYGNEFDGEVVLNSPSKNYKKEVAAAFTDELYLSSDIQQLYLSEPLIYELDRSLKGKMVMESQEFLVKSGDGVATDKYKVTVVFECILEDKVAF